MVLVVNAAASPVGAGASPRFDSLVTKATKKSALCRAKTR